MSVPNVIISIQLRYCSSMKYGVWENKLCLFYIPEFIYVISVIQYHSISEPQWTGNVEPIT